MIKHMNDLLAAISHMFADRESSEAREGVVSAGSWSPKNATISATMGDSYAVIGDDNDQPMVFANITPATTAIGDEYGARGGERVTLVPSQSGFLALYEHGPDDSPGAPAGERWICHRNAAGAIDAFFKLTNDGTAGDGLGGISITAGSRFSLQVQGWDFIIDPTAKYIQIISGDGLGLLIDNTAGVATIGNATGTDFVVRKSDLQAAITALAARVQGGSGVAPPTVTASTTVKASS